MSGRHVPGTDPDHSLTKVALLNTQPTGAPRGGVQLHLRDPQG
jgi:hypothetical protein